MKTTRVFLSALMVISLFMSILSAPTRVAAAASAAVLKPSVPVTISPIVDTVTNLPTYSWTPVSGATSYKLLVKDSAGKAVVNEEKTSTTVCYPASNLCIYTPSTKLSYNKTYQWSVAAKNSGGTSSYSSSRSFTTRVGFTATFNLTKSGWSAAPYSSWKPYKNFAFYTTGASNKWSALSNNQSYSNFTYEAKILKTGIEDSISFGLIFRGSPTYAADSDWKNTYYFLINNQARFSIWITKNNVDIKIKDWTDAPSIKKYEFNTLKVVTDGMNFRFFVNGQMVWADTDDSFAIGRVGVASYRNTPASNFYVDYAKLSKSIYYTTAAAALSMPNITDIGSAGIDSGMSKEGR